MKMMETRNPITPKPVISSIIEECIRGNGSLLENSNSGTPASTENDTDFGAVMYIIAVLVFYSAGIVVMIIKYLRTERKEMEEEAVLDSFFKDFPDSRRAQEHNVNKVAIRAFHTLTSVVNEQDGDASDNEEGEGGGGGEKNKAGARGARGSYRGGTGKRVTLREQPPRRVLITDV